MPPAGSRDAVYLGVDAFNARRGARWPEEWFARLRANYERATAALTRGLFYRGAE